MRKNMKFFTTYPIYVSNVLHVSPSYNSGLQNFTKRISIHHNIVTKYRGKLNQWTLKSNTMT